MIWLVAALLLGVALQLPPVARLPLLRVVWPTYLHLMVVGWLTQLIFGVAFWLFPRYSADRPRGSERLGWATFACLNLGLMLRLVAEPWRALGGDAQLPVMVSATLHLAAVWLFAINTWPRVRER